MRHLNFFTTLVVIYALSFMVKNESLAETTIDNVIGERHTLTSKNLTKARDIQIYLPENYDSSTKTYPVLYLLDGQRFFSYGVSIAKSFSKFNTTPDFIVVGIDNKQSLRNNDFFDNSAGFLNFIDKELIPFVNERYRTSAKNILFGWAFAGSFTIKTLVEKPNLFDAFIAASPYPVSGGRLETVDEVLISKAPLDKLFYFAVSVNEGPVEQGTDEMQQLLKEKASLPLEWVYSKFDGEDHNSTPYPTLYRGVKKYFSFYKEMQFKNLDLFDKAGGMSNLYDYYKKRAKLYGFPAEISDWTQFTLVRSAIRENKIDYADKFLTEFGNVFIQSLRSDRIILIARFYLDNQRFEEAKTIYSIATKLHPELASAFNGLGHVYAGLKDKTAALQHFQKAVDLATKDDNQLIQYQKDLTDASNL